MEAYIMRKYIILISSLLFILTACSDENIGQKDTSTNNDDAIIVEENQDIYMELGVPTEVLIPKLFSNELDYRFNLTHLDYTITDEYVGVGGILNNYVYLLLEVEVENIDDKELPGKLAYDPGSYRVYDASGVEIPTTIYADSEHVENSYRNPRIKPGGVASGVIVFTFESFEDVEKAAEIVYKTSLNNEYITKLN